MEKDTHTHTHTHTHTCVCVCVCISESLCCTTEINIVNHLYFNEINFFKKNYYEQFYAKKMDNLEEIEKLLETYNLPRLNNEKTENWNRPIISEEIESVIKNLPTKKRTRCFR